VQVASNSVAVQVMALRAAAADGETLCSDCMICPTVCARIEAGARGGGVLTRSFYLVRHASDRTSDRLKSVCRCAAQSGSAEISGRLEREVA
jgi:hypothetical protein